MLKITDINKVRLSGRVLEGPEYSHKTYGEAFYLMLLGIFRKSGNEDRIRLIVPEKLLGGRSPKENELLDICGQIRTYNRRENGRSKLEIMVFVQDISRGGNDFCYENEVDIEGYICKEPVRRSSPLGREICDLLIAVNRPFNKSDYIPTIAWGRNAVNCSRFYVGDKVQIKGRIQSREYRKYIEEKGLVTKTAYELSAIRTELVNDDPGSV